MELTANEELIINIIQPNARENIKCSRWLYIHLLTITIEEGWLTFLFTATVIIWGDLWNLISLLCSVTCGVVQILWNVSRFNKADMKPEQLGDCIQVVKIAHSVEPGNEDCQKCAIVDNMLTAVQKSTSKLNNSRNIVLSSVSQFIHNINAGRWKHPIPTRDKIVPCAPVNMSRN